MRACPMHLMKWASTGCCIRSLKRAKKVADRSSSGGMSSTCSGVMRQRM